MDYAAVFVAGLAVGHLCPKVAKAVLSWIKSAWKFLRSRVDLP